MPGKPSLELLDERVHNLEGAIEAFRTFANQLTNFSERLVKLEEHREQTSTTLSRSFDRLEKVEHAIVGDGTDDKPGLYSEMRDTKSAIKANTYWTRLIFGAIMLGLLAWSGNTLLDTYRTSDHGSRIEVRP